MTFSPEVGRELKVSELKPRTVVCLFMEGRAFMMTLWVMAVSHLYVRFRAGVLAMDFIATRCGTDLEEIADEKDRRLKIYEYLGEV